MKKIKNEKKVPITTCIIGLYENDLEVLKDLADTNDVTVPAIVRQLVNAWIKEYLLKNIEDE